ncbi:hypothetical protein [Caminibacter pacificus]|uniref:Uncharacterized protein n=1 Tax=Caminibacter pacificus TaxID=1424653 RepID=A0AAJ4RDP0_9BACT|nr:hypothetical protein [Caminibacter pacificus]QCI28488.1 hypothetical protein C6V80_05800 [Caminibacter pacificus]ROR40785.1 hypothetical protein EDC58_0266 [Caminibacter pacificus]
MSDIEKEIALTKQKIEEIIKNQEFDFKDLFNEEDLEKLKKYSQEFIDFLLEKKEMPIVFLLIAFITGLIIGKALK